MSGNSYDLIIVGGGPAGLSAGLYASRGRLKALLLEQSAVGGQVITADKIENYPGFPKGIIGSELIKLMKEQALEFGLEIKLEKVEKIETADKDKNVISEENEYGAEAVIIATGAQWANLNVPGEKEFRGRGVSYCATCDAPFFKNKEIVVVGGGDTAVGEAVFLSKFCKKITLVHRRQALRATQILQERIKMCPNVEFIWDSVVVGIFGKKNVEAVRVKNVKSEKETDISSAGIFIFTGLKPNSGFLGNLVDKDEGGYIKTNENLETSLAGIFAAGDVRQKNFRQIVSACSEGAWAAFSAQHYVDKIKGRVYK